MRKTEVVDTPAEDSPPAATPLVPKTALAVRSRASGSVNVCAEWRMTSGGCFGALGFEPGLEVVLEVCDDDPQPAARRPPAMIAARARLALIKRLPPKIPRSRPSGRRRRRQSRGMVPTRFSCIPTSGAGLITAPQAAR